jgi:putative transposase
MLDFIELEASMAKRFKEEEIVKILKEAEEVGNVRDVIRKYNVSEQSFYRWRQKYGGMETSEVRRLKDIERENAELKKIVADLTLDNRMLRDVNSKKW